MPHIPAFPPRWRDWAPGTPDQGEPPLPRFLFNPRSPTWIPYEMRRSLEEKYGYWAVRRAESALPRSATPAQIEEAVKQLYEAWWMRIPHPVAPS